MRAGENFGILKGILCNFLNFFNFDVKYLPKNGPQFRIDVSFMSGCWCWSTFYDGFVLLEKNHTFSPILTILASIFTEIFLFCLIDFATLLMDVEVNHVTPKLVWRFLTSLVTIISQEKNSGWSLSKVRFEIVPVSQKVTLEQKINTKHILCLSEVCPFYNRL